MAFHTWKRHIFSFTSSHLHSTFSPPSLPAPFHPSFPKGLHRAVWCWTTAPCQPYTRSCTTTYALAFIFTLHFYLSTSSFLNQSFILSFCLMSITSSWHLTNKSIIKLSIFHLSIPLLSIPWYLYLFLSSTLTKQHSSPNSHIIGGSVLPSGQKIIQRNYGVSPG